MLRHQPDRARRAERKIRRLAARGGMLNTSGSTPERIACWREVFSDDPNITGYLKMIDTNALDNTFAPPEPVSTQVNVIELKKTADGLYSYLR